jgi:FKBP-type peptidyl-prolyl cis-trans isomerase
VVRKWAALLSLAITATATAQNLKKPPYPFEAGDLKSTSTGLKYAIVSPGDGPAVRPGDKVKVFYHGVLDDGKVFDSNFGFDDFSFEVGKGEVIPGWDEGLALLREGDKAVLVVPPQLAYGDRKVGSIPPNSTLTFHILVKKVIAKR